MVLVRRSRLALASTALAIVSAAARPAAAQPRDPATAESLFRSARDAANRGDYATACPQLAESQRLDPAPGTLMNLADCEEHLGKVASAWEHFVQAREQLRAGDDRIPFADQRVGALAARVPHLVVRLAAGAPAGAKVLRDQVALGAAALGVSLAVEPGPHTLTVLAPDRVPAKAEVTLREGETRELEVSAGAPERAPWPTVVGGNASEAKPAEEAPADDGGRRTLAFVAGGVGLAGLATGAITGAMAFGAAGTYKGHCDASGACDPQGLDAASSGKSLATVSTVAFVLGLAGAGAGAYLWLTRGSGSATPKAAVGVTASPNAGVVTLGGRF